MAKSSAEKTQEHRDKKRAKGFKLIQLWTKPGIEGQVREFNDILLSKEASKDEL